MKDYAYWKVNDYNIGRVQRMIHIGMHGRHDYKLPVPFESDEGNKITVYMMRFEIEEDGYKLTGDVFQVKFHDILTHVNLSSKEGLYEMSGNEGNAIEQEVKKRKEQRAKKSRKHNSVKRRRNEFMEDDGMQTIILTPSTAVTDGRRMSTHVRRVKQSETCNNKGNKRY